MALPNYKIAVDWLSITGKLDKLQGDLVQNDYYHNADFARQICGAAIGREELLAPVPATRHYAASFVGVLSGIRVNIGQDISKQGWQIVLAGGVCSKVQNWRAVADFIDKWRGKVTRCDISLDLIDGRMKPDDFRKQYEAQYPDGTPRQFSFIKSRNGDTVYIGSRTSDRMMRIYDKAAEQGVRADWMRVEMEYKNGEAHRAFETFLYNPLSVAAEFYEFLNASESDLYLVLRKIAQNAASERRAKPAVVGDTEKWLSGQVMSSFEKLGLNDEAAFERVFAKFQETYLAVRLWNILNPLEQK